MKNVQVRFSDEEYGGLNNIATEENTTLADVVRKSLQLYGILRAYQKEGKILAVLNEDRGLHAELVIPGITTVEYGKDNMRLG